MFKGGSLVPLTSTDMVLKWLASLTLKLQPGHCNKCQKTLRSLLGYFAVGEMATTSVDNQLMQTMTMTK